MAFGALFLVGGLVVTGRGWSMGHSWHMPGEDATADRIEGTANLRFGAAAMLGGGCVVAAGTLLYMDPHTYTTGLIGWATVIAVLGILVAVGLLMRSGIQLSGRASNVRVRERLPRRPKLYLVWPPPPDKPSPN